MVEDQITPAIIVDEVTRERVHRIANQIKQAAIDVNVKGEGVLVFPLEDLQEALNLLLFSTEAAEQAAKDEGLILPDSTGTKEADKADAVTFKLHSIGNKPVIQTSVWQPGPQMPPVNLFSIAMDKPEIELGIHGAKPKVFQINSLRMVIGNDRTLSDGKRKPGQITVYRADLIPDTPVNEIPGITGPELFLINTTGATTVGGIIKFLTDGSHTMTQLHNRACPIIAANGPEHTTTKVSGVTADIDNNTLTMRFKRDQFIRYSQRTGFPQKPPFSFTKK